MSARTPGPAGIDRAAFLGLIDGIEQQFRQQLDALRALLAPDALDDRPAPPVVAAALNNLCHRDPDRIHIKTAAFEAGRHETTIARWIKTDPGLGIKVLGQWWISRTQLQKHIEARKTS